MIKDANGRKLFIIQMKSKCFTLNIQEEEELKLKNMNKKIRKPNPLKTPAILASQKRVPAPSAHKRIDNNKATNAAHPKRQIFRKKFGITATKARGSVKDMP